jgi:hypothetical protein
MGAEMNILKDVSAMEVRGLIAEIRRLEDKLPSIDPWPYRYSIADVTLRHEFVERVLIEDWNIFGGIDEFDLMQIKNHKTDLENMLNV